MSQRWKDFLLGSEAVSREHSKKEGSVYIVSQIFTSLQGTQNSSLNNLRPQLPVQSLLQDTGTSRQEDGLDQLCAHREDPDHPFNHEIQGSLCLVCWLKSFISLSILGPPKD